MLTPTYCDGSDPTIMAALSCQIPLTVLQASPYSLSLGNLVQVTVSATNTLGDSQPSLPNSGGALIETVPQTPASAPARGEETGEAQVQLLYTPLAGSATGGSPITSYIIWWDQGQGGALTALAGQTAPNLALSLIISTGIASG